MLRSLQWTGIFLSCPSRNAPIVQAYRNLQRLMFEELHRYTQTDSNKSMAPHMEKVKRFAGFQDRHKISILALQMISSMAVLFTSILSKSVNHSDTNGIGFRLTVSISRRHAPHLRFDFAVRIYGSCLANTSSWAEHCFGEFADALSKNGLVTDEQKQNCSTFRIQKLLFYVLGS